MGAWPAAAHSLAARCPATCEVVAREAEAPLPGRQRSEEPLQGPCPLLRPASLCHPWVLPLPWRPGLAAPHHPFSSQAPALPLRSSPPTSPRESPSSDSEDDSWMLEEGRDRPCRGEADGVLDSSSLSPPGTCSLAGWTQGL